MENRGIDQNIVVVFPVYCVFNRFSWKSKNHKQNENRDIGGIFIMLKHFFLTYMYQYHSVTVYLEHVYSGIAHWNFPVLLSFLTEMLHHVQGCVVTGVVLTPWKCTCRNLMV